MWEKKVFVSKNKNVRYEDFWQEFKYAMNTNDSLLEYFTFYTIKLLNKNVM